VTHDDVVAAHAQHDDESDGHAGKRAGLERARHTDGKPQHRHCHGQDRMAVQRLAQEETCQQRGDERRGAEHQQHIGDGGEAQRQDEGDETAGQQQRTQQKRSTRIADVRSDTAAFPQKQWQHRGNQQGRAPKRHIPGRQVDCGAQ